jgi:diacylglycerol O-acyltransferase / wax synthase
VQRMNGIDPMFIYSETAETPMEVAYACVFDPSTSAQGYSFPQVRELLLERVPTMAAFRRRLMTVPFGLDHPRWVDDPEFSLDNHLHRVALPAPGGQEELTGMVAEVMGRPLAVNQPPWEMHIIEGLSDGRVGLIAKVHHSVIDGVAGAQLLAALLDLSADGRPITEFCPPWFPPALPSGVRLVTDAIPNMITSPLRALRALREIGRTAVKLAQRARDADTGPLSIPLGAPATFETPVGASRSVSFAELNLRQVKDLRARYEVTVNDVVMATCSGALRTHLANHHQETDTPLVAVVPVSVRGKPEEEALGNRLSAMFVPLSNDRAAPLERLEVIAAASKATKAQERAVGYGPMASAVTDAIPPALAKPMVKLGVQFGALRRLRAGNLMISNVPGPNIPLFFAGMRMEAVHPLGPVVDGVALNITVQSYMDSLFVGINACSSAVPDLPGLASLIAAELNSLHEAALAERPLVGVGSGPRTVSEGTTSKATVSRGAAPSARRATGASPASHRRRPPTITTVPPRRRAS